MVEGTTSMEVLRSGDRGGDLYGGFIVVTEFFLYDTQIIRAGCIGRCLVDQQTSLFSKIYSILAWIYSILAW